MQAERGRFTDWMRCFTFFTYCNLCPAAGLSPEAEISWQRGLHGELLADPLPGVTGGCGSCGGSCGSVGPQSLNLSLKYLVIFLCKDKWLCSTQDPVCCHFTPALFSPVNIGHALEGPASCSSRVQKQPLGRQLLPLKGYQLVLLPNTPSFQAHPERTSSPMPL